MWNKSLCIEENKALSSVGEEVCVNGKNIRVSLSGEGDETIVLLSEMGTPNPITDFKPLADKLSRNYRVVTLEYAGYGFSDDSSESRTNEAVVEEIYALARFMDATGLTRLSNASGVPFIQEMENSKSYSKEDMKNVIALVNQKAITKAQYSESRLLNDNCKELLDVKYPNDIPVLQILSNDTCESDLAWIKLHEEMIANPEIQKTAYLEGYHHFACHSNQ